jgi:hypothetical protein
MYLCNREIKITGHALRIARLDADKYQFLSDPEPLIQALRNARERIDLFTFMQRLPQTKPLFGFPMEWDNLAVLPVSTFDNWWKAQIGFKARNKAKQAEKKGIVIREVPFDDVLVRGIAAIYNEVPVRQGRKFPHYGKDFDTVYKEEATYLDCSTFIGAYLGDELIGFIKLVADEVRVQAGLMNIISKVCHRDKDSIIDFKERNGFQRVDLPRYYVPLTGFGSVCLRLGLHRRFVDRLPESVVAKARGLRNSWYSRKVQPAKEAS